MTLFRLWRVMRRRGSDAAILREEMAAHLRALEEEYRSRGLSAELRRRRPDGSSVT